ncbi:MAG: beta-ketoacyl-ACP reductase [Candidatus Eisenbacteria bacterium RBG_16_71_46]|nr:MAG: beta-ketoacyl-ACP reductase [Candidatus Eisenbacteria bacterium RBG_16_71_46]
MNLGLEGRVAIVTGGAAGIGAAIAVALAREGCDVAIVDREVGAAAPVAAIVALGRKARAIQADVRDHAGAERAVETVVAELGRLDILVCNAGITSDAVVWKMSEEQWDTVIDVNLKGYFNYNRAAARRFMEQKGGKIVNIASINGLRGKFGQANYAASKGGVVSMSKTLARELGKFNVNVNVVAPGMVQTEMVRSLPPEVLEKAVDETAVGRLATPEDCADVVVFLCSDRARHITGEVIQVDGGQYI